MASPSYFVVRPQQQILTETDNKKGNICLKVGVAVGVFVLLVFASAAIPGTFGIVGYFCPTGPAWIAWMSQVTVILTLPGSIAAMSVGGVAFVLAVAIPSCLIFVRCAKNNFYL